MKSLAKGQSAEPILKLIKQVFNVHQSDYQEAVMGDTSALADVADQIEVKKGLYTQEEVKAKLDEKEEYGDETPF